MIRQIPAPEQHMDETLTDNGYEVQVSKSKQIQHNISFSSFS